MKTVKILYLILLVSACVAVELRAQGDWGKPCGSPSKKNCNLVYEDFAPHDLSFNTGRQETGTGRRVESNEFYAVILESVSANSEKPNACAIVSEKKRLAAQKFFPKNKVFASRNNCSGMIVYYEGMNNDFNFAAVYGGETEAEAKAILKTAKKKYPSASIRKMTVVLDFADE